MANKQQVIDLHKSDPTLTSVEIGRRLKCCDAYVRATFKRNSLKLPKRVSNGSLLELGRACRDADLSLKDILDIAAERRRN